jgi:hypothetical protein
VPLRLVGSEMCIRDRHDTMPPIPEDATISLGFSTKDMPQR